MKHFKVFCLALWFAAFSSAAFAAPSTIRSGGAIFPTLPMQWKLNQSFALSPDLAPSGLSAKTIRAMRLVLRDGTSGATLEASSERATQKTLGVVQTFAAPRLQATQTIESQNDTLLWRVEIKNLGPAEARLEVGLQATLQSTTGLQFWDGYGARSVENQTLQRDEMRSTFPATALLWRAQNSERDADAERGVVIGVHPDADISSLFARLDPKTKTYFYGTRFAIPAGQSAHLDFVVFALAPRFGFLDAIQGYYQRFPKFFQAQPDVDPRLAGFRGTSGSYIPLGIFHARSEAKPDFIASLGSAWSTWDWGYATFKTAGDWVGRPESWNLSQTAAETAAIEKKSREGHFDLLDLEKFHRERQEMYRRNDLRGNVSLAFYIINFGAEELLKKNDWMRFTYPYYSPTEDPATARIENWVTGYDTTWHVFPWASPFEGVFRRDLPDVLKELDTTAFAIDVFSDVSPYRGPTERYLAGWSYDAKGKFIRTSIAHKKLVNFIHTLRSEYSRGHAFRAGVVGNNAVGEHANGQFSEPGNFVSVLAADAYLWEGNVSYLTRYTTPGEIFPTRYLMGAKTISNEGGGYSDKIGELIPWEAMSPNAIRRAYDKYLKTRVMALYQVGLLPDYNMSRGLESHIRATPILLDLLSRGFCASPASTGNPQLQRRRYGNGLNAAVVYSNPTQKTLSGAETLLNPYLGDFQIVPFEHSGRALKFAATRAQTVFPLTVESFDNHIIECPIGLRTATDAKLSGTTTGRFQAHQRVYEIELNAGAATQVNLGFVAPRDFQIARIECNGAVLQAPYRAMLKAGKNRIEVLCASRDFKTSEAQLQNFDFKNAQIALPENPHPRERAAAQMLIDYASFYRKINLPIVTTSQNGRPTSDAKPTIYIETNADAPGKRGVWRSQGILRIVGADPFDTQQLAWRLIRLLTARDPYLTVPQWTNTSTLAMLDKIGLITNKAGFVGKVIRADTLAPVAGEGDGAVGDTIDFAPIEALPRDGWIATASAQFVDADNNSVPANALDGKPGTSWTPGKSDNDQWFQVDMRQPREFNHIQLQSAYPSTGFPRAYRVEISDDGQNWREVARGAGDKTTDVRLPKIETARFIRVTATDSGGIWWTLDEFLIFRRAPKAAG